jgi:excisionase family DNA binding protein
MKQFLSTSQISKLEGVSTTTVQRWVREGYFPNARKVGRLFRVPLDDYHRWRESTKIIPGKPTASGQPSLRPDGRAPQPL